MEDDCEPVEIRRGVTADAQDVQAIWRTRPTPPGYRELAPQAATEWFQRRLELPPPFGYWLATNSGGVVGWASALPFRATPSLHRTMAEFSIVIGPEHRGLGYGGRLLERLLEELEASDVEHLVAFVEPKSTRTIGLLQSRGFVQVGTLPGSAKAMWRPPVGYWVRVLVDASAERDRVR